MTDTEAEESLTAKLAARFATSWMTSSISWKPGRSKPSRSNREYQNKSVTERKKYACVPIPSWFTKYLPTKEPFSKLEAYFSLRVDYQKSNTVSLRHKTLSDTKRLQTKKNIKHIERHKTSNDTEDLQTEKHISPDTTILLGSIDKDAPRRPPTGEDDGAAVTEGNYIFVDGEFFPRTARASTSLCDEGIKKRLREKKG
jgi:hypothetical protein